MATPLKEIRKKYDITQEELATRLEMKQSHFSKIENGEKTLSWNGALGIQQSLQTELEPEDIVAKQTIFVLEKHLNDIKNADFKQPEEKPGPEGSEIFPFFQSKFKSTLKHQLSHFLLACLRAPNNQSVKKDFKEKVIPLFKEIQSSIDEHLDDFNFEKLNW